MSTLETTINKATHMDAVTLRVGDLENMTSYYTSILDLDP
ncbi:MAG: VOC family protein, partial [Corynebacterium sp.]|nr:VOC family protein [Corynebacterium sp.]